MHHVVKLQQEGEFVKYICTVTTWAWSAMHSAHLHLVHVVYVMDVGRTSFLLSFLLGGQHGWSDLFFPLFFVFQRMCVDNPCWFMVHGPCCFTPSLHPSIPISLYPPSPTHVLSGPPSASPSFSFLFFFNMCWQTRLHSYYS
ncbi:MAG: hypothetical protein BYD32DRAFT_304757 [Podila humilis]|nr:MAG: hypothetical protein BYD32DRAFT_304757 [Podila humilis]